MKIPICITYAKWLLTNTEYCHNNSWVKKPEKWLCNSCEHGFISEESEGHTTTLSDHDQLLSDWPRLRHNTSSLFWHFQPATCAQRVMETEIKASCIIALPPWGDKAVVSLLTLQHTLKYPWGTFVSYWCHKCQIRREFKILHFKLSYYVTHATYAEERILKFIVTPEALELSWERRANGGSAEFLEALKHACGTAVALS